MVDEMKVHVLHRANMSADLTWLGSWPGVTAGRPPREPSPEDLANILVDSMETF